MALNKDEFVGFSGHAQICRGVLVEVALACKAAIEAGTADKAVIYRVAAGQVVDVSFRGTDAAMLRRLRARFGKMPSRVASAGTSPVTSEPAPPPTPRKRGRPKLGVVGREISLLPRHWEWLAAQRGGASVTLRKLVEAARKQDAGQTEWRQTIEAAYGFMSDIAGDFENFEESSRALFASDLPRFNSLTTSWPTDIREHLAHVLRGPPAAKD
ncbi:MAG: DUF2239 family protein [Nannocystaceae bacterium]|nr:DUF2239 family protein [Nannocystaceae bacterium]